QSVPPFLASHTAIASSSTFEVHGLYSRPERSPPLMSGTAWPSGSNGPREEGRLWPKHGAWVTACVSRTAASDASGRDPQGSIGCADGGPTTRPKQSSLALL